MIVRVSGEGQYELDDAAAERVNDLERNVIAAVEEGRSEDFGPLYAAVLDQVRTAGKPLADDDLRGSEVILPPADISFDEAGREFSGEGLIPE